MTNDERLADDEREEPGQLGPTAPPDQDEWMISAVALIDLLARSFGRTDLADTSVLDVGCGTRFTKAFLERGVPIGRYVGVDASTEVVDFLRVNVTDPRCEYHHIDARSDLYNPTGQPLRTIERLPVGEERFDIICLFSVFTHLRPDDYRAMLELVRPHAAPDGGLLFSLSVERELDPGIEAALGEHLAQRVAEADPAAIAAIERELERRQALETDGYLDQVPERPLRNASYTESRARALIEGTGWEVVALHPPEPPYIEHYFVCRPA